MKNYYKFYLKDRNPISGFRLDGRSRLSAFGLLLLAFGMITGCKKFIEVPSPPTQLLSTAVFNNGSTATSAMLNIYRLMYSNTDSYTLEENTGWLGDEFINYGTSINYYQNSLVASATYYGPWQHAYSYIYQANAVISGLSDNNAISPAIAWIYR